ncbi:hypothetical protein TNCV_4150861 [Trichonephila clavipes]|nr:hypothetical protein TNCV_4150861 [Trichonephila clavipes]
MLRVERRRRIHFDYQKTSLAGLALDSATSSGLGRAPALQCRTPSRHHLELQDRRDYAPADRAARTCWEKEKITRAPRERETRTHLKKVSPLRRFSDEAHFWLNGYVNKQNCSIWSEANPQVYVETPLYPEKLTVWGA